METHNVDGVWPFDMMFCEQIQKLTTRKKEIDACKAEGNSTDRGLVDDML